MGDLFCFKCVPRWIWAVGILGLLSTTVFAAWRFRPPPHVIPIGDTGEMAITFHAYDANGKLLQNAILAGPLPITRQHVAPPDGSDCKVTRKFETNIQLIFENDGVQQNEDVVWRKKDEFKDWIKTKFPLVLKQRFGTYNESEWTKLINTFADHATDHGCEYPVAFGAKR